MIKFSFDIESLKLLNENMSQKMALLRRRFYDILRDVGQEMAKDVQTSKLGPSRSRRPANYASPQVLGIKTGRLRNSIKSKVLTRNLNDPAVEVGVYDRKAWYGAIHEFGYTGNFNVPAHTRRVNQVFGRPMTRARLAIVKAHTRRVVYPRRAFLGPLVPVYEKKVADRIEKEFNRIFT